VKNIRLTYGDVRVSDNVLDDWSIRGLGPGARGKIASDEHWYMSFRKENGAWRIWRVEFAVL
jgi:hypothetical protein